MISKQRTGNWSGLRVLITSNSHEHYNRVVTIIGREASEDGQGLVLGRLNDGQEIAFSEGQYKLISLQN